MFISDAGAVNLAVGVIEQAVIDYRFAQRMSRAKPEGRGSYLKKSGCFDPMAAQAPNEQSKRLEAFFLGKWFHTLADLDGEEIVRLLRCTTQQRRVMKTRGIAGGSCRTAQPEPRRRPGKPIDWEVISQWPDIKKRIEDGGWSRGDVARAMGSDASALLKLMRFGTEKTRKRMLEALEKLEGRK